MSERARRRLLATLLGLGLALLAGEVLVRVRYGAPLAERLPILEVQANEHRGWSMVPEDHYTYRHRVRMSSLGLRGPEPRAKAEDTRRVLCLGDSLTYGQGIADHETLPACLERALNAAGTGTRWEAINAGHRAYATNQELGLLEELGPVLRPDVVVVLWYWNDIEEHDLDAMYEHYRRTGPVTFDTRTALEGAELWLWHLRQLLRRSALLMKVHDAVQSPYMGSEPTDDEVDEAMARQEAYYRRFLELGEELGFRLLVAMIPDVNALGAPAHFTKTINARLRAVAEAHGVPVIDLEPAVQRVADEAGRAPVVPYDGHYDADANRAMAEAVARALLETEPR